MKRYIIITLLLLLATAFITVVYFKNLNPPGTRTSKVMNNIPDNAAFILEFNNDNSFYDIFNGNQLFKAIIGKQKLQELDTLRQQLLGNPLLRQYFTGQNIFISLHPSKANDFDFLLTMSAANGLESSIFERLEKLLNSGLVITPFNVSGKQGYNIYINLLKKRFYLINNENNVYSGSFSKELAEQTASYKIKNDKQSFVLLSAQQNANSLANLYVNYGQLSPLFDQLFQNKNADIFKSFRLLPALAALSLNYRSDALMFNGSTFIQHDEATSYLSLFTVQQPVVNRLKDIFPSTTAYATSFSVSDPLKFGADLSQWHIKAGLKTEKDQLFNKIQTETGVRLKTEFNSLLGNEFAVVTTRYMEKLAIISVNDGSKMKSMLMNISKMTDVNSGQLNYDKVPFFILGDAFSVFRRPCYMIIDNYLILANSSGELKSYYDSYINRKFLSKNDQYNQFDDLLAGRSNVAFFFHFKNSQQLLERDMKPAIYDAFKNNQPGWANFYAASWQLTATDKNFYTNFCMKLNTDTIVKKNK